MSAKPYDIRPTATKLYAANGSAIKVVGEKRINLDLGLRRNFSWSFIVADVTTTIIGADFIRFYDLLIDLRRNRIIDNLTKLRSSLTAPTLCKATEIKTFDSTDPFADLLSECSEITKLAPHGFLTKSTVVHRILTTSQPVFSRPRRLAPEKLTAARNEFNFLLKAGICRPSNWSSPLHMVTKSDGTWRPCGDSAHSMRKRCLTDTPCRI
ncbi:uncharacterized protein LOC118734919 [Rhagoletis pomonella]|uniref:uncharacterized protein LOC118734919 n=1 Tax=Rhagoletis pomonella TaxID=28610 RepID=UPI00177F430C|nr:uncharacterized protein LOC118734919 [Rhagoletis pomonella]